MPRRTPAAPPEPGAPARAVRPRPLRNHLSTAGPSTAEAFTPVPRKTLSGWTADRQRRFIAALAATGSVAAAAAAVEMTREGAYLLRAAPGAAEFVAAWDSAVRRGIGALRAVAFDRAINGEAQPVFWQGEQIGERRAYNNQLLMRLLTHYDRQDSAAGASSLPSAEDPRPSTPAVAARIASNTKQIAAMDETDFRRNAQWGDYAVFLRSITRAMFIRDLRRLIAQGGYDAILEHLDWLEGTERKYARLTPAMHEEITRTGTLAQPWRDGLTKLEMLLTAENVEAAVNAGVLPVR